MSKIKAISGEVIKDSRGEDTVLCRVELESGVVAEASVPQGKSTGSHEAVCVSASDAVKNIEGAVSEKVVGLECESQKELDDILCELAGEQKKEIGGNTTLAVSIAVLRACAQEKEIPLWKYIKEISQINLNDFPKPFVNMINGGVHTGNTKLFQEYMIVPQKKTMRECISFVQDAFSSLEKVIVEKFGETKRGDEGGFALTTDDPSEPLKIISEVGDFVFCVDVAANGSGLNDEERTEVLKEMTKDFNLKFIEDPYGEEEFEKFALLKKDLGDVVVVGDDLTTTNKERLQKAVENGSVSGVIIKPNQIGTVSEAIETVKFAKENNVFVIASHRSRETPDSFIADFAYGVGADGIKIGSPSQRERKAKYDRLLEIESEIRS